MFGWFKKEPVHKETEEEKEARIINECKEALKKYPELQKIYDEEKANGMDEFGCSIHTLVYADSLERRAKDPEAYDRAQREREEAQRNARLRREMQEMQARQRELDLSKRPGAVQCPYCKSYDTTKITAGSRVASAVMWGVASNKLGKQWHCNKCKSNF